MDTSAEFGDISGLRVNISKSSLIFPTKCCHSIKNELSAFHGVKLPLVLENIWEWILGPTS